MHQLHLQEAPTIFQPPYVHPGTRKSTRRRRTDWTLIDFGMHLQTTIELIESVSVSSLFSLLLPLLLLSLPLIHFTNMYRRKLLVASWPCWTSSPCSPMPPTKSLIVNLHSHFAGGQRAPMYEEPRFARYSPSPLFYL